MNLLQGTEVIGISVRMNLLRHPGIVEIETSGEMSRQEISGGTEMTDLVVTEIGIVTTDSADERTGTVVETGGVVLQDLRETLVTGTETETEVTGTSDVGTGTWVTEIVTETSGGVGTETSAVIVTETLDEAIETVTLVAEEIGTGIVIVKETETLDGVIGTETETSEGVIETETENLEGVTETETLEEVTEIGTLAAEEWMRMIEEMLTVDPRDLKRVDLGGLLLLPQQGNVLLVTIVTEVARRGRKGVRKGAVLGEQEKTAARRSHVQRRPDHRVKSLMKKAGLLLGVKLIEVSCSVLTFDKFNIHSFFFFPSSD